MRRACRKDANHNEIKSIFGQLNCSVIDVSGCPCGFDLVVGYGDTCIMVEVKDGAKPKSARKLTDNEELAHMRWKGPKAIVTNTDEAFAVASLLRHRHFRIVRSS